MVHFELVSLGGIKFSEDVYEVLMPTVEGMIGIMPGHMPFIGVASHGAVGIRRLEKDRDEDLEYFAINGGVIEVSGKTNLTVLVDEADSADEISEQEAQKAFDLAKKLKSEATDQISIDKAQSLVDRSAVRLQVAGLKRRNRRI